MKVLILLFFIFKCSSPLTEGNKREDRNPKFAFVNEIGLTSVRVNWTCPAKDLGFILYGIGNYNIQATTNLVSEFQTIRLTGLNSSSIYQYQVFCGQIQIDQRSLLININAVLKFTTLTPPPSDAQIRQRGIWLLGGIGSDSSPIGPVDLFDPVENRFYANITSIPTPRAYAQIVSHKNKIYVMGGITRSTLGVYNNTRLLVEEYDVTNNTWQTKENMPITLQGAVVGSVGEEIVLIAGTTTHDMTTGTLTNQVYKFRPDVGVNGIWTTLISASAIFPRVDMAYCTNAGNIFYAGGRISTGIVQSTSDSYITSTNSITNISEASISLSRSGSAAACYRPNSRDPFPTDEAGVLIVGGTILDNIVQPPSAITPSDRYEFMPFGVSGPPPSFTTGPILPIQVYHPAIEISYELRKAYVFGGAAAINLPTDNIYSIGLVNPVAGPWTFETIKMPRARFGHRAVIVNR